MIFKIWIFTAGLAIGSFLSVVIYRLPRGFKTSLPSRSYCTSCRRKLAWFENVPVLSFIFLRGKCRVCEAPLSYRYPLVEILTGALFVAVYQHYDWGFDFFYFCYFAAILVAITFIDLDFRIIPDAISFPGIFLGIVASFFRPDAPIVDSLLGAAAGGLFFWALSYAYYKITGRDGLGFGDVKLLALIGAFLGPEGVFVTVLVSSIFGSLVGIAIMVAKKGNMKMAIPYGPFLAIGAFVHLFWGDAFVWLV